MITKESMSPTPNSIWILYMDNEAKIYMVRIDGVKSPEQELKKAFVNMMDVFNQHRIK